jgi:hypothetical protein
MRHQSTANAPSEHDECATKTRWMRRQKPSLPQTKPDRSAESTQNIIDIFKNSTDISTNIIDILTNSIDIFENSIDISTNIIDILSFFGTRSEIGGQSW